MSTYLITENDTTLFRTDDPFKAEQALLRYLSMGHDAYLEEIKDILFWHVPYSELAMHYKIAGLRIDKYKIDGSSVQVWICGDELPYQGLVSELLPFELRK